MVQKLRHFFEVTDGQTHGHTDKNESPQYHYIIFFLLQICEGEAGKLYKPYEISTFFFLLFLSLHKNIIWSSSLALALALSLSLLEPIINFKNPMWYFFCILFLFLFQSQRLQNIWSNVLLFSTCLLLILLEASFVNLLGFLIVPGFFGLQVPTSLTTSTTASRRRHGTRTASASGGCELGNRVLACRRPSTLVSRWPRRKSSFRPIYRLAAEW